MRLPGGAQDSESAKVAVKDSEVLNLGDDGLFRAQEYGADIVLAASSAITPDGIQLGKLGVAASVAREHVSDILGTEDFSIGLQLKADVAGTKGEIFRLHGSIIAEVNTKGELYVRAFTSEGAEIRLTTTGTRVNDLKTHDIDITLDDGRFRVLVDGKVSAEAAFAGTLQSDGNHPLTFGNPWNKTNFNGDLSAFDISVGEAAPVAPAAPGSLVLLSANAGSSSTSDPGHDDSFAFLSAAGQGNLWAGSELL